MTTLLVPVPYATITAAIAAAAPGDTIRVEASYSGMFLTDGLDEIIVTKENLTFEGLTAAADIVLVLDDGLTSITTTGTTTFNIVDNIGNNTITTSNANSVVGVTGGVDTVTMGTGTADILGVDFTLATGNVTGNTTNLVSAAGSFDVSMINVDHFAVATGSGNDNFTLGTGDDIVHLGAGNDTVDTGDGLDIIDAGDGAGLLEYGFDLVSYSVGIGNDTISSGAGNDLVIVAGGQDNVDMGAGTDDHLIIKFGAATSSVTGSASGQILASESGGTAFSVILAGVERVTVTTGSGDDNIALGAGNDIVDLGSGSDAVDTGAGDDAITLATGGTDSVDGGADTDTLKVTFAASGSAITGGSSTGTGTFNASTFGSLAYFNIENFDLILTSGNDNITTGAGADFIDGGFGNDTMNGGDGNDFYFVDSIDDVIVETNADTAIGGIDTIVLSASIGTYVLAANVERINLQGNANARGNSLANTLNGSGGDNTLDGGVDSVADILNGGTGNDIYVLRDGTDTVIDAGDTDEITTTISRNLADYIGIENLRLEGSADINGTGVAGVNQIFGNSGNNILDGGGADNAFDYLAGGAGDDSYIVYGTSENIYDASGTDTILLMTGFYSLVNTAIENLTLLGNATGGSGNEKANVIIGNAEAVNYLDGGGTDNVVDTLIGGDGDDWYTLYGVADTIIDSSGIDRIYSTVTLSLANFTAIEDLYLLSSTDANGTGNGLVNTIVGNHTANILDGGNDNLVDTLIGASGNDTFVLHDDLEIVYDQHGIDTITSTISRNLSNYTLSATNLTQTIENLTLLGSAAANGTGNGLANIITGNSGANILDGGLDSVVDSLNGDAGNDTYVLANGADNVIDASGIDTITSTITRSLLSYAAIENLTLLGSSAINGTGNTLANTIIGNGAVNTITGGRGVDILTGGGGADKFQFNTLKDSGDKIIDMRTTDFIVLQNAAFTGLTSANKSKAFVSRVKDNNAQDTNDRLIYRQSDDTLWYDSNGSSAGGTKIKIADFSTNISLTAADILII